MGKDAISYQSYSNSHWYITSLKIIYWHKHIFAIFASVNLTMVNYSFTQCIVIYKRNKDWF